MPSQPSAITGENIRPISQTGGKNVSEITGTYAGRLVSVTVDGGATQAVIDFSLGRIQLTLPPELTETLREGDLLKLLFQGGNVRLEKRHATGAETALPEKPPAAFPPTAVTFTPSGTAPTIRDLIDFEEGLIRFLFAQTEKSQIKNPATLPLTPPLRGQGGGTEEALPVLLLRVLESTGGKEYLATQIRALNPELLKSITATLARLDPPAISGDPRNFVDLLRGFRGALSEAFASETALSALGWPHKVRAALVAAPPTPAAPPVLAAHPLPADPSLHAGILAQPASRPLLPPFGGQGGETESHLGRALILAREPDSGAAPPVRAALVAALNTLSTPSGPKPPQIRYTLDLGGTRIETYSSQHREPGDFVVFQLDRKEDHSGKSVARFQEPEITLPPALRTEYSNANPAGKSALMLAADTLKPYMAEPGFPEATRDFARLLVDTGRLAGPSASLPASDELDALFRLLLAFPRDSASPTLQARAWSEVARNPGGFESLLRLFRPEQGQALLDPQQSMRPVVPELANFGARPSWTPRPGELPPGFPPELPGLLEKALAEKSAGRSAIPGTGLELRWDAALQADRAQTVFESGPAARPVHAGGLEKFLQQALAVLAPCEEEWKDGQSRTLYFFHGEEWKQVEARWTSQNGHNGGKALKPADRPPVRVDISLRTENLGDVRASLSLDRKGSRLDFRSERSDIRDLLAQSIHPLEHLLRDLDLRLASWTYTQLATPSPTDATTGRVTAISADPSSTLDIFG